MIDEIYVIRGQKVLADRRLTDNLAERRVPLSRDAPKLSKHGLRPASEDGNHDCHDEILTRSDIGRQYPNGSIGRNFHPMDRLSLGPLIASRRKQAGLSQAALAKMLPGLTRSALNSIENGQTKTVAAAVANEMVKILPVSMPELVRAMEYDLPSLHTTVPEDLVSDLEIAPPEVLAAVRLVLNGWRSSRQEQQLRGRE